MSRNLMPASESISNICLSDDSAVTTCSSRTPSKNRLQFLPNSKRSPRATSSARHGASSLLRAPSIFIFLLRESPGYASPGSALPVRDLFLFYAPLAESALPSDAYPGTIFIVSGRRQRRHEWLLRRSFGVPPSGG